MRALAPSWKISAAQHSGPLSPSACTTPSFSPFFQTQAAEQTKVTLMITKQQRHLFDSKPGYHRLMSPQQSSGAR